MAAAQRDIRQFENEQEALPAALAAPSVSSSIGPSLPSTGGAGRGTPLGMKLPDIITTTPTLERATSGLLDEHKRINQVMPSLQGNVDARRDILQGELEKPMPAAPKLQDVPQFQPRQLSGEELTLFGGIAMALAGLGTKAMRGDLTMALNAAGSAMKGFNEGNLQQSRLDLENFKKQMDGVIAQNHKMSDEYRAIIENRKLSLQQKDQALRVAASARDDQVMISALNSGQLRTVFDLESHRINAANQASIRSAQIYNTAMDQVNREEPLVPVQMPDGRVIRVPRSEARYMDVPSSTQNRPPPSEIMRMNIAVTAAGKALDNYEKILKSFDPRSWDQMDPAQRAKIQAAISATQLEWKEAAALGALTGPDLEIMSKTLVNPATIMGAYYDRDGLNAQINEARGYFGRRREAIKEFYPGIDQPGGRAAPGAGPRKIANDAEYNALPSGAEFIGPDGQRRRKP